jgi:penicillin-binding protein 1A
MFPLPSITLRVRGRRLAGRLAFTIVFVAVVLLGAAAGLIFVYSTDLPEIRALEDYRPNVVTELYSDDGQQIGNFALQRRILLTWEQIPPVLKDAITSTEDQHFFEHWGVDLPRVVEAAWRNVIRGRIREGASTLTMQLAGGLFLDRSDRSFRRKIQETLLAIQIERNYTKQQIFTMYANQVYLAHGNYGFEAASEFYFGRPVAKLTCRAHSWSSLFADHVCKPRSGAAQPGARSDAAGWQDHRAAGTRGAAATHQSQRAISAE